MHFRQPKPPPRSPQPPQKSVGDDGISGGDGVNSSYQLVFYGVDLNKVLLMEWLRKCGRQKTTKKSYRSRESLSQRDLDKIQVRTLQLLAVACPNEI